jgi:hypothetical protein
MIKTQYFVFPKKMERILGKRIDGMGSKIQTGGS